MSRFIGKVKLSPVDPTYYTVDVEFDASPEEIVYDDVIDGLVEAMEEKYPSKYYPVADIEEVFVEQFVDDKFVYFPVICDSDDESKLKKYKTKYHQVLILPCYRYSLSTEYKLHKILHEHGFIADEDEFDYDKMKTLISDIKHILD